MSSPNPTPTTRRVVGSSGPVVWKPASLESKEKYLKRLPFHRRYPRAFVVGGGILTACTVWSGVIYSVFRTPPENYKPEDSWWPGEKAKGKSYKDQWFEKQERMKVEREKARVAVAEAKARMEAKKAEAAAAKS
ncbi:hypothetical protein Ocin01_08648 [Orchesella cincta]|uniref:Uncharacterized protein n=1 Tax=Orchesella cincta TaxID=48709 RepID=A0A1D2MYL8_ORCCI|nr:hypothetical protein Ocin01_08648 [Orchesella cincta]